jgi:hypothetical protein
MKFRVKVSRMNGMSENETCQRMKIEIRRLSGYDQSDYPTPLMFHAIQHERRRKMNGQPVSAGMKMKME